MLRSTSAGAGLTAMGLCMQSNAMRYDREHKARTHKRIVRTASRQLRAKGLNGSAVNTLMKASGLTHGGFYRHFGSRDELVVEAIEESLEELGDRLVAAARGAKPGE